jgi:hypothetical protein
MICIFIRMSGLYWKKVTEVDSLEAAEEYWRENIKGRGRTAWTEFVEKEKEDEFLRGQAK